jgi:hypothetical protein
VASATSDAPQVNTDKPVAVRLVDVFIVVPLPQLTCCPIMA